MNRGAPTDALAGLVEEDTLDGWSLRLGKLSTPDCARPADVP
jgi:hypothetical protein